MGSFEYTLNKYKGKEELAVVPEDVTKIGYRAFANNLKLTEVRMSDGVDQIGENAFTSCQAREGGASSKRLQDRGRGILRLPGSAAANDSAEGTRSHKAPVHTLSGFQELLDSRRRKRDRRVMLQELHGA